jgi:hypothetical protein
LSSGVGLLAIACCRAGVPKSRGETLFPAHLVISDDAYGCDGDGHADAGDLHRYRCSRRAPKLCASDNGPGGSAVAFANLHFPPRYQSKLPRSQKAHPLRLVQRSNRSQTQWQKPQGQRREERFYNSFSCGLLGSACAVKRKFEHSVPNRDVNRKTAETGRKQFA